MASLDRVRLALTGFVGGPGVCTFYAVSGSDLQTPLNNFANAMAAFMPPVVTLQVEQSGDTIEDTDGALTGSWTGAAQPAHVGSGTAEYAAPVGFCCTWLTPIVRDGHRIKGRSFIVPVGRDLFQSDGSIEPYTLVTAAAAADALVSGAGGNFRIWHRPRLAQVASPGHRALAAHDGSQAAVTASSIRDKAAVLRSRRD